MAAQAQTQSKTQVRRAAPPGPLPLRLPFRPFIHRAVAELQEETGSSRQRAVDGRLQRTRQQAPAHGGEEHGARRGAQSERRQAGVGPVRAHRAGGVGLRRSDIRSVISVSESWWPSGQASKGGDVSY